MKKQFMIVGINMMLIAVALTGCIDSSNTKDDEDTNGEIPTTVEEMIIGTWERDDNRTFTYKSDGTLNIESAAYEYRYWFKDGYLFDSSEGIGEPWEYKYNISFEDIDTMILTYLGYLDDGQWNNDTSRPYVFKRVE